MISAKEVAAYHRDGLLVVEDVLDAAQLREARRVVDEFIQKAGAVTSPGGAPWGAAGVIVNCPIIALV